MVTVDHAEALELHTARNEAFVKSNLGVVWGVFVLLVGWFVFAGIPAWIVAAVNDSVSAGWATFAVITLVIGGSVAALMRSS